MCIQGVEAEQSCIGAALTADVGTGCYRSYEEACDRVVHFNDTVVEPIAENVRRYSEYFEIYRRLYAQNKSLFDMYPQE